MHIFNRIRYRKATSIPDELYQYKPLLSKDHIRVLRVFPGRNHEPLQCVLERVELKGDMVYKALSYTWENQTPSTPVYVRDGLISRRLLITENLASALAELRHPDDAVYLWADAICINQTNIAEKNVQVRMMGDIYAAALGVIVWLGHDQAEDAKLAFDVCEKVYRHPEVYLKQGYKWSDIHRFILNEMSPLNEQSCSDFLYSEDARTVINLLCRSWFKRIWVIQEIAKAKSVSLRCGGYQVPWVAFLAVMRITISFPVTMAEFLKKDAENRLIVDYPCCMAIVIYQDSYIRYGPTNLWYMLRLTSDFSCTDDRDRVYGLLSLAANTTLVDVDYTKPVTELYNNVATTYLLSGETEILSLAVEYQPTDIGRDPLLKSYTPDWRASRSKGLRSVLKDRYCAATRAKAEVRINDHGNLSIRGYYLGEVSHVCDMRRATFDMPQRCKQFIEVTHGMQHDVKDDNLASTFKSLLGDEFLAEAQSAQLTRLPNEELLAYIKSWLDYYTTNRTDFAMAMAPLESIPVHKAIWGTMRDRTLFHVQAVGKLGLGSETMQQHDIVCILLGCKIPFVLRPASEGYELVSQCYIHDIMQGELLEAKQNLSEEATWFSLI